MLAPRSDLDMNRIEELVSSDPGLVARILRIVNSAYYGLPRPLSNLRHALAYLGLGEVYRIVLTATVIQTFGGDAARAFWRHSYTTALAAKQLARPFEPSLAPGDLWPAALLHDIGEMVELHLAPEAHARLQQHREQNGCLRPEAEAALDQAAHTELGALLCEHWELPPPIRAACLHHETGDLDAVDSPESRRILRIVTAADHMTHLALDTLRPEIKEQLQTRVGELLQCSEETFLLLMGDLYEVIQQADRSIPDLVD